MATNPFHYGTPATGPHFTGRRSELAALVGRMRSEINVSIISPRRYGKTSLLLRSAGQVQREAHAATAHVNVLRCRDVGALAAEMTTAAFHGRRGLIGRGREALNQFRRRIRIVPSTELAPDGKITFSFSPSLRPSDADKVIADIYGFLAELAEHQPAVLILDEFQALSDLGPYLPDLFKGLADTHPHVCLVIAGSQRRMMERLVQVRGAPLYGMTQPIALGPIPSAQMVRHLLSRARAGGKEMPPTVAAAIIEAAGPVPNDIQRLAYETYAVATGDHITHDDAAAGLAQAVQLNAATYSAAWAARTPIQRRVLAALSDQPTDEPYARGFVARSGVSASSLQRAIATLDDAELIIERNGTWQLTDPFLAAWIRSPATP